MERATMSVCPVCLQRVAAIRRTDDRGRVWMEKTCPQHGSHRELLWRGYRSQKEWVGDRRSLISDRDCSHCTGLCQDHERDTCCTLLEITDRCNLHCRFCFADPGEKKDPSYASICEQIRDLTVPGKTFLQLSGGEPTVREDLPKIIAYAKRTGCRYIQLNTNGLKLADPEYAACLKSAGLDIVFLQFDGVTEDVYRALRGRDLLEIKKRAIEGCGAAGLGVTLVPTVVPGINDRQLGDIVRFGIDRSPVVRGIHFQPVSYFGRLPFRPTEKDRYTLDQLMKDLEEQAGDQFDIGKLRPSCCDHPLCGFHGDYMVLPSKTLHVLGRKTGTCCQGQDAAEVNREFVGRRWSGLSIVGPVEETDVRAFDITDMDTFLNRVRSHGFTITAMAFQDAGNLDEERLRSCSLHVYRGGRKIPFCAAYLSPWGE